ncbi:hypothetical protein ASZ90_010644 [hydrocarbon metagenome]|uniref:Uncharacterized protein n=1 Tax=hydrocarbon metagenome TaxID=938273 RepID=A0A0W8FFR0_9ZZZZ
MNKNVSPDHTIRHTRFAPGRTGRETGLHRNRCVPESRPCTNNRR